MNIQKILNSPEEIKSMTTLTKEEFDILLPDFEKEWKKVKNKRTTLKGLPRKLKTKEKGRLAAIESKLFFILFYFTSYPTQRVMGALFEINYADANRWVHRLAPLLKNVLKKRGHCPQELVAV